MECPVNLSQVLLVQSVVQISHMPIDFFVLFVFFNYSKRIVEVFQLCVQIFLFLPFCPLGFCFMYPEAPLLSAWAFTIVSLFVESRNGPLCCRQYSALYFDITVAAPAFLLLISVHTLYPFISFCFQYNCVQTHLKQKQLHIYGYTCSYKNIFIRKIYILIMLLYSICLFFSIIVGHPIHLFLFF